MTLLEFLLLLVIAGICGSVGQAIGGSSRGGCLVSIALGFIGASTPRVPPSGDASHLDLFEQPAASLPVS